MAASAPTPTPAEDLVIVHTSDLHLGSDVRGDDESESLNVLRQVLVAAQRAQILLVAGDLFDNNRLPLSLLGAATELLAEAAFPVVILPGNHDPLTPDSVYYRGPVAEAPNVCVLGLSVGQSVVFPNWDLEIWGHAHRDYSDMSPLRDPPGRTTRWRIAVAHGHFDEEPPGASTWWPSWRIRAEELAATRADYVALGHWNRAAQVGDGATLAYYSGSPDLAATVNVVRLASDGSVQVTRKPVPSR